MLRVAIFDNMSLCTAEEVQKMLPLVSAQRRENALKYKHVFGQWAALKSWMMWESLVDGPRSLEWKFNEYGKPYIGGGPEFSISHCKEGIAVAVDDKPIGIDIESIRKADEALIQRTMNIAEQQEIAAAEKPEVAFTALWTRKEAYLKYLGTGIIDDLHHVLEHAENVQFETVIKEKYVYTICYEKDIPC